MAGITITNSTGNTIQIADSELNQVTDITLIGSGREDFIAQLNKNFIVLLESFANSTIPTKASTDAGKVIGQLWYDTEKNKFKYRTGSEWISNTGSLNGKTLDQLREYVLSGLDTSGKLSVDGGTISGKVNINGAVSVTKTIVPDTNETVSLGGPNSRFRNIYLKEDGIVLGEKSKGLQFNSTNFVYAVEDDDSDVSNIPSGAIIIHQGTGEAIIKKSTGSFGSYNATFRKLSEDQQNSARIGGNNFIFMGSTALVAGGWNGHWGNKNISQFNITKEGPVSFFGNLSIGRSHMGSGMSNNVKGLFQGGWSGRHGTQNAYIDYVVFTSPGNAIYFGSFGSENYGASAVSDGTRGVIGPGYDNWTGKGHHYMSKYITLDTASNASNFGTIRSGYWGSAISSGTRGIFGGYTRKGWSSALEYITIQTPKNSIYFGASNRSKGPGPNAVTDMIRGVYFGGWNGRWNNKKIEYLMIATPGNTVDFGNVYSTVGLGVGVSDGTKGVSAGGYDGRNWISTMESVTISTPSNAKKFGDLTEVKGVRPSAASGN